MITVNMDKAKIIGHKIRRIARSEEFAPYDEVIAKQIPGADYQAAELARQSIRQKYAEVQNKIDGATTPEEIKSTFAEFPENVKDAFGL